MSVTPKVSVIVPHYRDLAGLDACLAALSRQTFPRDSFEVVVADNASPEGVEAVERVVAGRGRVVVVTEKGAGPARNGGVEAARGEILAFTDCDCIPAEDWLEHGLASLKHCDFAGGAMKVLVVDPSHPTPEEGFERVFAFNNASYVHQKGFTVTANLFCPRRLFDQVGGFRTGISEDLEWCHRASRAGYRLGYAADAVVGHPARRNWGELVSKWERLNLETYGLYRRELLGRWRWVVRSCALPMSAVVHTPRVLKSSELEGITQKASVLMVLYRLRFWRMSNAFRLALERPR